MPLIGYGIEFNPVRDVLKSEIKEKPINRFLSEYEVKELWFNLDETNIYSKIVIALKMMLVTGQRVEEVLRINRHAIDKKSRLWVLEDTKNKRPHAVPLSDVAMRLLEPLKADVDGYLLSAKKGGLIKSMTVSQAVNRYCKASEFNKFTPRDLRRTWKTLAGKAGISKHDRDLFQNHSLNDVSSEHYDRYDYLKEKKQVARVWNAYLVDILGLSV